MLILQSSSKDGEGRPRFEMPIPDQFMADPGIAFLVKHETEYGGYEYSTRKFLDSHLQPGDTFVDVGAHWGIFSLTAATRWPGQIRIWALEPHPINFDMLRVSLQHNHLEDWVSALPVAAGEKPGILSLSLDTTMGHSLRWEGRKSVHVAVQPLDTLLEHLPQSGRIFLKIDAEGFEPEIIRGARKILAQRPIAALIWEKGVYFDRDPGLTELRSSVSLLADLGFMHYRFRDENAGGTLQRFELNNERLNIFSLRGVDPLPNYEKPPGKNAPPIPPYLGPGI